MQFLLDWGLMTNGLKSSFQMISKLSLLHNCTNEELYFYLKSFFHTRSLNQQSEGILQFRERKHGLSMLREMLVLFWYFPPVTSEHSHLTLND